MRNVEDSSGSIDSYLLEHSLGTCELWVKHRTGKDFTCFEPLKLQPVSGPGTVMLCSELIAEAMLLQEWMADHLEVFKDGRTTGD